MEEVSQALVGALLEEGPAGRRFDQAVLRDAVPVLLLSIADRVDTAAVPDALLRMVDDFLERAEANRSEDPEVITAAIARYLEAHPLPGALWQTVEQVLAANGAPLSHHALDRLRAFASFSGDTVSAPKLGAAAPTNSVSGGLLARAKLHKKGGDR